MAIKLKDIKIIECKGERPSFYICKITKGFIIKIKKRFNEKNKEKKYNEVLKIREQIILNPEAFYKKIKTQKIRTQIKPLKKCDVCDYQSNNIYYLSRHMEKKHGIKKRKKYNKTYKCNYCKYETKRKDNYDRHNEKKHHIVKRSQKIKKEKIRIIILNDTNGILLRPFYNLF